MPKPILSKVSVVVIVITMLSFRSTANGVDYFEDALKPGPNPLLYFGHVVDDKGMPIARAQVYVSIEKLAITLETHGANDGSYQTHDLVKALHMIGETVDPAQLKLYVIRTGYKQVEPRTTAVGPDKRGRMKVDFIMHEN